MIDEDERDFPDDPETHVIENGLSAILSIDENMLDEEWIGQPRLFFQHAEKLAGARNALDEAKVRLEIVKAGLSRAIREDPASFGLPKITEASVEAAICEQAKFITAQSEVRHLKHKVDVLAAAVTALDHRKKALENLVTLHGQNYFSVPQARTPEDREAVRSIENEAIRKKNRRTRG